MEYPQIFRLSNQDLAKRLKKNIFALLLNLLNLQWNKFLQPQL